MKKIYLQSVVVIVAALMATDAQAMMARLSQAGRKAISYAQAYQQEIKKLEDVAFTTVRQRASRPLNPEIVESIRSKEVANVKPQVAEIGVKPKEAPPVNPPVGQGGVTPKSFFGRTQETIEKKTSEAAAYIKEQAGKAQVVAKKAAIAGGKGAVIGGVGYGYGRYQESKTKGLAEVLERLQKQENIERLQKQENIEQSQKQKNIIKVADSDLLIKRLIDDRDGRNAQINDIDLNIGRNRVLIETLQGEYKRLQQDIESQFSSEKNKITQLLNDNKKESREWGAFDPVRKVGAPPIATTGPKHEAYSNNLDKYRSDYTAYLERIKKREQEIARIKRDIEERMALALRNDQRLQENRKKAAEYEQIVVELGKQRDLKNKLQILADRMKEDSSLRDKPAIIKGLDVYYDKGTVTPEFDAALMLFATSKENEAREEQAKRKARQTAVMKKIATRVSQEQEQREQEEEKKRVEEEKWLEAREKGVKGIATYGATEKVYKPLGGYIYKDLGGHYLYDLYDYFYPAKNGVEEPSDATKTRFKLPNQYDIKPYQLPNQLPLNINK
jgi:hypothetical protein